MSVSSEALQIGSFAIHTGTTAVRKQLRPFSSPWLPNCLMLCSHCDNPIWLSLFGPDHERNQMIRWVFNMVAHGSSWIELPVISWTLKKMLLCTVYCFVIKWHIHSQAGTHKSWTFFFNNFFVVFCFVSASLSIQHNPLLNETTWIYLHDSRKERSDRRQPMSSGRRGHVDTSAYRFICYQNPPSETSKQGSYTN